MKSIAHTVCNFPPSYLYWGVVRVVLGFQTEYRPDSLLVVSASFVTVQQSWEASPPGMTPHELCSVAYGWGLAHRHLEH